MASRLRAYLEDPFLRDLYDEVRSAGPLRSISLDLSHRCNLRCTRCYFFEEGMERSLSPRDEAVFDAFVQRERQRGTNFVTVVGGEPTLEIDRLAKLYRSFSRSIATNGLIRIPVEGFEELPIGVAVWGGVQTDRELRGGGRREIFETGLQNYRDDSRAFWYYTVAAGHAREIEEVVERYPDQILGLPTGVHGLVEHELPLLSDQPPGGLRDRDRTTPGDPPEERPSYLERSAPPGPRRARGLLESRAMEHIESASDAIRYGWVLDQGACIGCHACTVACKAENDVVLGGFRTWVKWIEHGTFPETSRAAAVLRCNHCADAPCAKICPTSALFHRDDGVVDLDRDLCIGCASCMQACPYDAIHIDDRHGTAAKCHFCAHRLEVGLAPACVSVCPEQAIWVVDLEEPGRRQELLEQGAALRKEDRGTQPNAFYLKADPAVLDPLAVDGTRTLSHAEVPDPLPAPGTAEARAVYDIPRARPWGNSIAAYMVTKAIAAGALLAACLSTWVPSIDPTRMGQLSLLFTAITLALLVVDLHRPMRFLYVLLKPNPGSWLVRGGWILTAHGALSIPWAFGMEGLVWSVLGIPVAFFTAIYTAYLFRQARGRELWSEDPLLPYILAVQAIAALAALAWFYGESSRLGVGAYAAITVLSMFVTPSTEHGQQAHRAMVKYRAFTAGVMMAIAAVVWPPIVFVAFALLDFVYVKAGQEVPLS